jgi:hypothetical protein
MWLKEIENRVEGNRKKMPVVVPKISKCARSKTKALVMNKGFLFNYHQ